MRIYQKFRDQRLAKNEAGRNLIALYYKHSGELSQILSEREELRAEARGLLFGCAPNMFLGMYKNQGLRITAAQHDRMVDFLNRLSGFSSPELQTDLAGLLARLADGSLQKDLGYTVQE